MKAIIEDVHESDARFNIKEVLIGVELDNIEITENWLSGWVGCEAYINHGFICFHKVKLNTIL